MPKIYTFLKEAGYAEEQDWLAQRLALADDPTPVIFEAALAERSPNKLCSAAVRTFVSILGSEAGNLTLKVMATGGVYIAGGIPPRILPIFDRERDLILNSFYNKGIMTEMLSNVPIHVITDRFLALRGAAYYKLESIKEKPGYRRRNSEKIVM